MAIKPGAIKPVITPSKPAIAVEKKTTPPATVTSGLKKPELTVASNSKKNDLGVQTLIGDYMHVGMNHGKKYYKKLQAIPGHTDIKVFLYYWDTRDGADASGWWFGDELGGAEVWARAVSPSNTPPVGGWKVPWNAMKPEPGLLTVTPFKGAAAPAAAAAAATPARLATTAATVKPAATTALVKPANTAVTVKPPPGKIAQAGKPEVGKPAAAAPTTAVTEARVKKASAPIEAAENAIKPVLAKAKTMTNASGVEALKITEELLKKQLDKLTEAQKSLTQDIAEARKAGPAAIASVTEMSKLSPRIRTASTSVNAELNRIRDLMKNAKTPEELAEIAEQEQKEYEESMPAVKSAVEDVAEAVETVSTLAAPILSDPPEDPGNALNEIDSAATSAQTKLHEVRQKVTTKLGEAKKLTSPDVLKEAVAEFTSMQNKLIEEQKKLDPLKTLKRDFAKRREAKKALAELSEKIADAELEAEKASMMTAGSASGSQMSEEDVKSSEELVNKARTALATVMKELDAKLKGAGASGPMKDELSSMRSRMVESTSNVNKIGTSLKTQREGLALQEVYSTAHEKVDKAEEAYAKCGDAELPFLKGIEVLPQEESDKAIKESETVAAEASKLLQDARTYLSQKVQEIKKYSKETQENASEELKELSSKAEEIAKKLTAFKKDTQERKVAAVMADAVDSVLAAEAKAKSLAEAGEPFSSAGLEEKSVEELKSAIEKATAADKECTEVVNEAKKVCSAKQKATKDKEVQNALAKLVNRTNAVNNEIAKVKKNVSMGEKVLKGKELSVELDTKITASEEEVEALVKKANPEDDGLGVETVTDAAVLEIDGKITSLAKDLKPMQGSIASFLTSAPAASKATFTKLAERCKACMTKVEEVKTKTKEQREKVLAVSFVKECTDKTVETEATLEKLAEAEAPYLKGVEVLPLDQSISSLKACDEASAAVQTAINTSKQFIASKQVELKRFDAAVSKSALEDMTKLTERINSASQQLSQFKKDTDSRKKTAALQEAGEKVKEAEAEVVKVSEFITPLKEKDPEALTPEEATATVKSLEELEEKANKCISETRNFCQLRQKEAAGDKEKTEQVKALLAKLTEQSKELSDAKKAGSTFIDKIKGKALAQEAADKLKEAEAEVVKATAVCAPLLEEKGLRFLVKQSLATMATALRTHMQEKDLSLEAMHKEIGNTQSAFVSFVEKMPEAFGREECAFTEERRTAMFKSADANEDGDFSVDDFKAMMTQRYICTTPVSVTDVFDIAASKTVCKLEKGALLESTGMVKKPEGEGGDSMPRLECKVVESGEAGWVTVQGSGGTKYLELKSSFAEWYKELEATLDTHGKSINKITTFFVQKGKALAAAAKDTPLAATRDTLKELGTKAQAQATAFTDMKKQLAQAKTDYFALERKEKNAHIEAKEQKEADEILSVAKPAVDAMEAEFKKLEEVAAPLLEKVATPDVLQEFATPLSIMNEAQTHEKTLKTLAAEAKEAVKKQQEVEAIKKATKGPVLEAKNELKVAWSYNETLR
jgi:DNA repair exonuclease SbcCD ATPase subunit